ncbi:MAG: hypothetical protein L0Y58_22985 [Verrucomicrobia subdivision 3 bacterium]|nr:hypothetical protein [Limisphaerales bacterium]
MGTSVRADKRINVPYELPIHIEAVVNAENCHNSPGPQVTVSGDAISDAILIGRCNQI